MKPCTESLFLQEVAAHRMHILRDDGLYRHLQFRKPGTSVMGFDLVTWPGQLAYSGDMGDYVFSRLPDMFEFFRGARWDGHFRIDFRYWAEKCQAADREGVTKYSPENFRERVEQWLNDAEASPAVRQAVRDEVLCRADDGEYEARRAARDFRQGTFDFTDFQEVNLHEFTYRFVWCCYAIAWGIEQYDAARQAKEAA